MIILPPSIAYAAVEIADAISTKTSLTLDQASALRDLFNSAPQSEKDNISLFLARINGITEEVKPEIKETMDVPVPIAELKLWWRPICFTASPEIQQKWIPKSAMAFALYSGNEVVVRGEVFDGDENQINSFISFKNEALEDGVVTEEQLDVLFKKEILVQAAGTYYSRLAETITGVKNTIITEDDMALLF